MDCDKDKMDQDIRLVCKDDNEEDAGCNHLLKNGTPDGKIIRLPDSVSLRLLPDFVFFDCLLNLVR
jgi:hypothetical protein